MDLAAFTLPGSDSNGSRVVPNAQVPPHDTVACYRLSGSTPQVWSVSVNRFLTDNGALLDLAGNHFELADLDARFNEITALHWSPNGQSLFVGLSSNSPFLPPTFIILSVHSGQLRAFPTVVAPSTFKRKEPVTSVHTSSPSSKLNFASWISLEPGDPKTRNGRANPVGPASVYSIGQSLCERLPKNLVALPMSKIESMRDHLGPVYNDNQSKALTSLYDQYPMVRFPPSLVTDCHNPSSRPEVSSLLLIASQDDFLHLFINGTVYAGTVALAARTQLTQVKLMPRRKPEHDDLPGESDGRISLQLTFINPDHVICYSTLYLSPSLESLPGPSKWQSSLNLKIKRKLATLSLRSNELNEALHLSHVLQGLFKDCLYGYFSIVKEWHVARMCCRKWYESFEDISKTHDASIPVTFQMLQLLLVGRTTGALKDFLGTKNADRVFTKWETTMSTSLSKIRLMLVELLIPDTERLFILVTELLNHSSPYFNSVWTIDGTDLESLLLVKGLLRELLKAIHNLDQKIAIEMAEFRHFCKWLRSEFDHVTAMENLPSPPSRPPIKYDLTIVSQFIQRGETNSLDRLIFSQLPLKVEDCVQLQKQKESLARSYHDEICNTNGPQKHLDQKKKLAELLSISKMKSEKGPAIFQPPEPQSSSLTAANVVTPDTSHFQMNCNVNLQTPTVSEHLKRPTRSIGTPSNAPSQFQSLPVLSVYQSHMSGKADKDGVKTDMVEPPLGIYAKLVYASKYTSEVLYKMFKRIGDSHSLEPQLPANLCHPPLLPENAKLCSQFVNNAHYSAFVSSAQELVITCVKCAPWKLEEPNQPYATISLKLVAPGVNVKEQAFSLLDMDFFDETELVLLGQIGSGFSVKFAIITIKFVELCQRGAHFHIDQLPVHRFHQLESEYQPEKISLNGLKGRKIGCVISGQGQILHVFDMESVPCDDSHSNM